MARYTDQQIRDKGFLYIPKQEYLQNPFEIQATEDATEDEVVTDEGIVNTNAFADSGGGDFSVYNPDPNTIVNQNYDDRPYQTALYNNSFPMMGDPEANITTGALNANGLMSYAEDDEEEKLTGIRSLISKGVNLIPNMNMLRMGAQAIGSLLPTNQRAIMENQAAGYGITVDDIGRIVGNPRTVEGSMAGYNLNNLTDKSFSKRQDTIEETMRENYGYTDDDIDNLKNGIVTESMKKKSINPAMSKAYGVPTMTNLVQDFINRNKFQDQLKDIITKTNIVYANENYDPAIETPVGTDTITGPNINEEEGRPENPGPSLNEQIDNNNPNNNNGDGGGGGGGASDIADEDRGGYATDDTAGFFAKGGRVKYFYGGKV